MKKLLAWILALAMLLALAGCSGKTTETNVPEETKPAQTQETKTEQKEETKTEQKEPGVVRILATPFGTDTDPSDMEFFKKMEEELNVKLEWEIVTDIESVVTTQIAAGGVTADIFRCGSVSGEVVAASGTVVTLSDYFDTLLSDAAAVIESNDYLKTALTCADGNIYWLPKYYSCPASEIPMIRQDWLDKLGLAQPTTIEELHDVLVAFRDQDPNGNGEKDEIPYDTVSMTYTWLYNTPWFGLQPAACWYWMGVDENNEIQCYLDTDNYKALITTLNQWYNEGLIFSDVANENYELFVEHVMNDRVGYATYANYTLGLNDKAEEGTPGCGAQYEFCFPPTTGFGTTGSRLGGISSTLHYVSNKGENTEDALRVFNYCFSHEGGRALFCGTEGEDYVVNADGSLSLGPKYDGMELADVKTALNESGAGGFAQVPIFVTAETNAFNGLLVEGGEKNAAAYQELLTSDKTTHLGEVPFRFTPEEIEKLTELQGPYQTYVFGELAKFIVGTRDLDTWDEFIATLRNEYALDELTALYANCYARSQK